MNKKHSMTQFIGICLVLVLIITMNGSMPLVKASSNELIMIDGKRITDTTTLAQIISMFGTPVLITPSAFGGKTYTFYGLNYDSFLFMETDEREQIISYGTIDEGFRTPELSYGDKAVQPYGRLSGCISFEASTNYVNGVVYYRGSLVSEKNYWSKLSGNLLQYERDLMKHSILMYNGINAKNGKPSNFKFNESLFLKNQQLKEQGSSLYLYGKNLGEEESIKFVSDENILLQDFLPNPLMFMRNIERVDVPSKFSYPIFDMTVQDSINSWVQAEVYFVSPEISSIIPSAHIPVDSVKFKSKRKTIKQGDSYQLETVIEPDNASNKDVTYVSSDKSVATVSASGKVKGIKAGKAAITVTTKSKNKKAVCFITISKPSSQIPPQKVILVSKVSVSNVVDRKYSMNVGESFILKTKILPSNATNKGLTYQSSNKKVVTVSGSGKMRALKEGDAVITIVAKDGSKKKTSLTVKVKEPIMEGIKAERLICDKKQRFLDINEAYPLHVETVPNKVSNNIIYSSDNEKIAVVDEYGIIKGVSYGYTTISVSIDGLSAEIPVCVEPYVDAAVLVVVNGVSIKLQDSIDSVIQKLGQPNRIDETDYNYLNYVYNSDYRNLIMIGISNGKVVSIYTNADHFECLSVSPGLLYSSIHIPEYTLIDGEISSDLMASMRTYTNREKGVRIITFLEPKTKRCNGIWVTSVSSAARGEVALPAVGIGTRGFMNAYELELVDIINSFLCKASKEPLLVDQSLVNLARKRSGNGHFPLLTNGKNQIKEYLEGEGIDCEAGSILDGGTYKNPFMAGHNYNIAAWVTQELIPGNYKYIGVGAELFTIGDYSGFEATHIVRR